MKQRILLSCALLGVLSLAAFGFINKEEEKQCEDKQIDASFQESFVYDLFLNKKNDAAFVYKIDNRFFASIDKEKLDKAQSILDIFTPRHERSTISYYNITISTYHENYEMQLKQRGENEVLTDGQIQLLQSLDYGESFYITGNTKRKGEACNVTFEDTMVLYLTVVPSKAALYTAGDDDLITYLKKGSKEAIAIAHKDQLQPGKISFKISKDGTLGEVKLTDSSGYDSIDEKMLELIQEMPGSWQAATNAKGEKVDQELTFFFGEIGC